MATTCGMCGTVGCSLDMEDVKPEFVRLTGIKHLCYKCSSETANWHLAMLRQIKSRLARKMLAKKNRHTEGRRLSMMKLFSKNLFW